MPRIVVKPTSANSHTPRARVLSGSAILLLGWAFVTLTNFGYQLVIARFLGPIAFGHTNAVYILFILISAVTLSFQIVTAKLVAQQASPAAQALSYKGFHQRAWAAGIGVFLLLTLFRQSVSDYLNLQDPLLIVLLAVGTLFYVPLGARRGYILGACQFGRLASSLVLEGLFRLSGSLLMIELGYDVRGVIAANSLAVVIAYFLARSRLSPTNELTREGPVAFRESLQAAVFFAGQVIINNYHIIVVKHFFPPESAGIYAAVAMVGRVVFTLSWAIVNGMFPISAETRDRKQDSRGVLATSLLLVTGICALFLLALRLAPGSVWTNLFGPDFRTVGGTNFRYLLMLYALSTGIYCLSVVLIAYEMSRKIANTAWVQLVVATAVIVGIYLFHSSLQEVIWVQIAMMLFLLLWVASPFFIRHVYGEFHDERTSGVTVLQRRVSEDEVIAQFLRNDFRCPEFESHRDLLASLLTSPDFADEDDNGVRRALLNVRHSALWRELPKDTEWYQAEITPRDLQRIRVFPRAYWRRLALGDFQISHIAARILDDHDRDRAAQTFREKINRLREQVQRDEVAKAILLIGQTGHGPFTILDGNHRLVAAMLTSPDAIEKFQFYCGLSPRMDQCCWYQTNVATLLRYGTNMVRYLAHDPEQDLARLLHACNSVSSRSPVLGEDQNRSVAPSR